MAWLARAAARALRLVACAREHALSSLARARERAPSLLAHVGRRALSFLARVRERAPSFLARALRPPSWGMSLAIGGLLVTLWSCCPARPPEREFARDGTSGGERIESQRRGAVLRGDASFYAAFFRGRRTANGERYDPRKFTAANRTLPLGTRLRVTRLDTGKSVVVRVNDRGPFGRRRRILDLSRAAAEQLDMIRVGHAEVEAVILE